MENKKTIIGVAVVLLLCIGYWLFLTRYIYPKHPNWDYNHTLDQPQPAAAVAPATAPSSGLTAETGATTTGPTTYATAVVVASTQPAGADTQIGSDQPGGITYSLGLKIESLAARLGSVTINTFKNADRTGLYIYQEPIPDVGSASLATKSVTIDGLTVDLSSSNWRLESHSAANDSATYGVDILAAGKKPLLHLDKTYTLQPRPQKDRDNSTDGYIVAVDYHLTNLSGAPIKAAHINFEGPTMPQRDMERSDDRQFVAGYDKGDGNVELNRDYLTEFKPGAEQKDISTYKNENLLWVGTNSNYFAAIVQPDKAGLLSKAELKRLNPDAVNDDPIVAMGLQTSDLAVPVAASADVPMTVFFGPKIRTLFEGSYYSAYPRAYNQLLISNTSFCGICAFSWLIDTLIFLLGIFHFIFRDWGLAIIALVVLVRAILHPISKHSQVSMLKLQKMGPEMERLKKKYGDDKEALSKAQMEMHKEMGITPFLGCLPMFLQMPIWIALYSALQTDIALRQAPFLWGWTWIHDLARPDRLITWEAHPVTVPFFGMKLVSLNILPLAVATVMFIQQKMQPQPPSLSPEQESQQKMMRYMSLAFSLFFYWMPSGLNLYILTSSTIAIFESKIIRDHIKQRDERDKAGKVIVDARPTRQGKQMAKQDTSVTPEKAGCFGLAAFWANLQQRAEAIQREAERKSKRNQ